MHGELHGRVHGNCMVGAWWSEWKVYGELHGRVHGGCMMRCIQIREAEKLG